MTDNSRDIFESLLDDIIADVNSNRESSVKKIVGGIDVSTWSPEISDARFGIQFRINRLTQKSRKSWNAFREMFHKFNDSLCYAMEQIRYISVDGVPVYMINNDKLNNDYHRQHENYKEFFQMDGLWFYNEKSVFLQYGYTTESFWNNVKTESPTFDVCIMCRKINIPVRRLPKCIADMYRLVQALAEKSFGEGQCSEETFIGFRKPKGIGNVRIVPQIINDIENGLRKSNVIDCVQRLHKLIYGEVKQDEIDSSFDSKTEYSQFTLSILHHFKLNVKDVIISETDKTTFITIPYDKSIRFTRSDIDWLFDKKALMNRYVYFEITGTLNTQAMFLSDRHEWYPNKATLHYTKRWEDFLDEFIAPNVTTWNAEFYETDQNYKIDLSRFYIKNMKVTFTGNSSNPLKHANRTAELIFSSKPKNLKIFNYQKNP